MLILSSLPGRTGAGAREGERGGEGGGARGRSEEVSRGRGGRRVRIPKGPTTTPSVGNLVAQGFDEIVLLLNKFKVSDVNEQQRKVLVQDVLLVSH